MADAPPAVAADYPFPIAPAVAVAIASHAVDVNGEAQ